MQCGPVTSRMVSDARPHIKQLFTSPQEAMFPHPDTDTRYLHARFALMDKNITGLSSSYCSYLLEIMRYIEKHHVWLVRDIENGTIDESIKMSPEVRASLLAEIEPMPARASELRDVFKDGFDTPIAPRLWPGLMYYATISTGFFTGYDTKLRERYLGDQIKLYSWGLNASEGLFSTTYDIERKDGALIPCSMFYEFLPIEAGDDYTQIITMDKLETGRIYEIILTNLSGLYRYRMGDAVRVTDKYNHLPVIQFEYRIDRTMEILDDHTSELALCTAAENTAEELGFELMDYSIYPDIDSAPARYVYFMEIGKRSPAVTDAAIRDCLEKQLYAVNSYLGEIIEKGLCGATVLHIVRDETYYHYRDLMSQKGKSLAQIKPVRIIRDEFQRSYFFDHIHI